MKRVFPIFAVIILFSNIGFTQSVRSLNNEGVDLYKKQKFTDAEVNFRKSLESDKDNKNLIPHFNLGDAYYKQGKYEDAIKSYNNVVSKTNDKELKSKSFYNIGNSLLKSQKLEESIEAYKNSLRLNPGDEDAKYNLSYALKLLQQQKEQQKNKNDKQDKNKDKNQDKQQNQDQNKDQQKKDQDKQQQNQQQKQEQKMSKEDAERMLNALKNNEKDLQKKLRQKVGSRVWREKDW